MRAVSVVTLMAACALTVGCDPFKERREADAERKRIECLDKICEGDVEPKRDMATEVAIKLNGQWYVGPKEYFSSGAGAVFYWPSKTPETGSPEGQSYPERGQRFNDVAIEVFLNTPKMRPPGKSLYRTLLEMDAKGLVLEKSTPRPGLLVWRTREQGLSEETWYVATDLKMPDGDPPTVACRGTDPRQGRCTTGFRWRSDVAASMRFRATHGPDWPEIYQETERVLKLLRRV